MLPMPKACRLVSRLKTAVVALEKKWWPDSSAAACWPVGMSKAIAMAGVEERVVGARAAAQVALKRVATAPLATGTTVSEADAQV